MNRKLNNGQEIPCVGFGTWQLEDGKVLLNSLETAYSMGCRHFDNAPAYYNECYVGEFVKTKPRENLFITSKLWVTDHGNVDAAIDKTMEHLNVDYLDLYLIHWPVNTKGPFNLEKVWEQMEECVAKGKAKSIGVSNFGVKNLTKLLSFCKIMPVVNQIELHPYLPQTEVKEFCDRNNIQIISYSSLGSTPCEKERVIEDPTIVGISKKHSASSAQVILSFLVGEGYCVIPRSSQEEHVRENSMLMELDDVDREKIRNIKERIRYLEVPEFGPHRFD